MTQARADFTQQTCGYCEGKGEVSGSQCKSCGGPGTVMVGPPPTTCSFCDGRGKVGAYRCGRCTGTGWMQARKEVPT